MMYQEIIAKRYAKGLMHSAPDGDLEAMAEELSHFSAALNDDGSGLNHLFTHPAFSPIERKRVIERMRDSFGMSQIVYRFLVLLVEKNRLTLLPLIHDELLRCIDEKRGRVRAHIESATPIAEHELEEIKKTLAQLLQKEVIAKATVASDLLGGIRVQVGGLIFDGTVKAKMLALKNKLISEVSTI